MEPTEADAAILFGIDYEQNRHDRRKEYELYVPIEPSDAQWRTAAIESRKRLAARVDKHNDYHSPAVV